MLKPSLTPLRLLPSSFEALWQNYFATYQIVVSQVDQVRMAMFVN